MFRKPKGGKKTGMRRRKRSDDSDEDKPNNNQNAGDDEEENTTALLSEARKRTKMTGGGRENSSSSSSSSSSNNNKPFASKSSSSNNNSTTSSSNNSNVMHQFATTNGEYQKLSDLVTSTVQHHPENQPQQHQGGAAGVGDDGIFRDKSRSKLLAGPIKATSHIRSTCRFDYQPDICKDYKDTGFCGYGDTCIYLHDRGDTLSGWQLEKQWEEEQKRKKEQQEREIQGFVDGKGGFSSSNNNNTSKEEEEKRNAALTADDGLPFACYICREYFKNPVVTSCGHYFCEACIMNRIRSATVDGASSCPICGKDTHGVFNQPTKLINKKRKVLGITESKKEDSWEKFAKAFSSSAQKEEGTM